MKNRGFTLVELLAVITLMALLSLAAIELLDSVNQGNKEKSEEIQIKEILSAAIAYVPTSDVKLPGKATRSIIAFSLSSGYASYTVEGKTPKKILSGDPLEMVCLSLDYLSLEGITEDNIKSPMTGEPYDNPQVCIILVDSSTKNSIEEELKANQFSWRYDGSYLYYFRTGDGLF